MKEKVWKNMEKVIPFLKIQLIKSGSYSPAPVSKADKKCKSFLSPCEVRQFQLMGEMNKSMAIEHWTRERKYSSL